MHTYNTNTSPNRTHDQFQIRLINKSALYGYLQITLMSKKNLGDQMLFYSACKVMQIKTQQHQNEHQTLQSEAYKNKTVTGAKTRD